MKYSIHPGLDVGNTLSAYNHCKAALRLNWISLYYELSEGPIRKLIHVHFFPSFPSVSYTCKRSLVCMAFNWRSYSQSICLAGEFGGSVDLCLQTTWTCLYLPQLKVLVLRGLDRWPKNSPPAVAAICYWLANFSKLLRQLCRSVGWGGRIETVETWDDPCCTLLATIAIKGFYLLSTFSLFIWSLNLLKPSGNFIHTGFNIKKFYVVPTLPLCVLYGSQNKQQLLPYKTLRDWFL
jgi:hypothetical protein